MPRLTVSSWGQLFELDDSDTTGAHSAGDRRLQVRYLCDMVTECRSIQADGRPTTLTARIRNISRRGINLLVNESVAKGSILCVEVPLGSDQRPSKLLACVLHVSAQADGDWAIGCTFVTELSPQDLEPFGHQPVASSDRAVYDLGAHVQVWYRMVRAAERQFTPAYLKRISPFGVELIVDREMDVGSVISLELQGEAPCAVLQTLACVVRVMEQNGAWSVSCNFIREITAAELESLRPAATPSTPTGPEQTAVLPV